MKRLISVIISVILLTVSVGSAEYKSWYSYVLMEGSTAALLYSDNGNYSFPACHSAKLMTMLLAAEAVDKGELSLDSVVKVSNHANSMTGTQIWLRAGEEIPVSDLILSITAGNANDACVALAEAVAGSEEAFVSLMNKKASILGMSDTFYADCTGISSDSYTTASDTAIVASHLSGYKWLKDYFTQYISYVRDGQTQIVNTNRLIRSYEPCTGMKYYFSEETQHCLISSAEKDGMTIICVIMGESDKDLLFKTAKEKLSIGLSAYVLYKPKATDIYCQLISVSKSVEGVVSTEVGKLNPFVVRKSSLEDIEVTEEYFENISAPLNIGDPVGRVVYILSGEEIYSAPIVASEEAHKLTFFTALSKILGELIKM